MAGNDEPTVSSGAKNKLSKKAIRNRAARPTISEASLAETAKVLDAVVQINKESRPATESEKAQWLDEFIEALRDAGKEFDADRDYGRSGVDAALFAIKKLLFKWQFLTDDNENLSRPIDALASAFSDLDRGIQSPLLTKAAGNHPPTPTADLYLHAYAAFVAHALKQMGESEKAANLAASKELKKLEYRVAPGTIRDWLQAIREEKVARSVDAVHFRRYADHWSPPEGLKPEAVRAEKVKLFSHLKWLVNELGVSKLKKEGRAA